MKKLLMTGVLAVTALALSQQQASAWVNSRFSIGINYHYQSGGNQFLWGVFTNGQPPGPEFGPCHDFGPEIMPHGHGHAYLAPQNGYGSPAPAQHAWYY